MSELSKSSLLKVFKGYMNRRSRSEYVSKSDAVYLLDCTIDRCELSNRERAIDDKPDEKSKIDVSGARLTVIEKKLEIATEALRGIASWDDGPDVNSSFDEPGSAAAAREALKKIHTL